MIIPVLPDRTKKSRCAKLRKSQESAMLEISRVGARERRGIQRLVLIAQKLARRSRPIGACWIPRLLWSTTHTYTCIRTHVIYLYGLFIRNVRRVARTAARGEYRSSRRRRVSRCYWPERCVFEITSGLAQVDSMGHRPSIEISSLDGWSANFQIYKFIRIRTRSVMWNKNTSNMLQQILAEFIIMRILLINLNLV